MFCVPKFLRQAKVSFLEVQVDVILLEQQEDELLNRNGTNKIYLRNKNISETAYKNETMKLQM